MSGSEGDKGGLLGGHAVAFWTVVTGIVAVISLVVTLATLRAGPFSSSQLSTPGPTQPVSTATSTPANSQLYFQFDGLSQYPCSDEGTIHSVGNGLEVRVAFINQSSSSVQIDWINGSGARQTYDTLAPGNTYNVNTYVQQVWLIADYQSTCLDFFYVNQGGDVIVK
jgi:hypothetical protein